MGGYCMPSIYTGSKIQQWSKQSRSPIHEEVPYISGALHRLDPSVPLQLYLPSTPRLPPMHRAHAGLFTCWAFPHSPVLHYSTPLRPRPRCRRFKTSGSPAKRGLFSCQLKPCCPSPASWGLWAKSQGWEAWVGSSRWPWLAPPPHRKRGRSVGPHPI